MLRVVTSLLQTPLKSLSLPVLSLSPLLSLSLLLSSPNPNPINPPSLTNPTIFASFSHSSFSEDGADDEELESNRDPKGPPKLFVIQPRLRPDTLLQSKLSEALNLANSLEEQRDEEFGEEIEEKKVPPHLIVQNPAARSVKAHADTYFGPGTVENVKCHLNAAESQDGLDAVFVNTTLSGIQQRNLERAWGRPVLDRVGLIIEIFNAHAQTKEAKLQSELAALMYRRTRLVRVRGPDGRLTFGAAGEAEVVSARGRGTGGRGFIGGAGETELQLQRRRVLERRSHLKAQIEEVRRTRALQRSARKRRGGSKGQGLATVAVVGYTNAGKSTLVGALSDTDLYSDDRLFATVDPRLRSVILPSGKKVLVSDTVGFISDLPVQLVEAFHATLEEVVEADLLVHVLDCSAPNVDEQRFSVLQVLRQIGVSEEKLLNMIEVWNKIDLLEKEAGIDYSLDQSQEDNESRSLSDAEDDDVSFKLPSGEPIDEDDVASEMPLGDTINGQDHITSDWLHGEPINGPMVSDLLPGGTLDDQKRNSLKDTNMIDKDAHCQPPDGPHVKVSATVGVGLQQLLYLIDEKLNTQEPPGKMSFDRKWRPPTIADSGTAVEY